MASEVGRATNLRRKQTVEPRFGQSKTVLGVRRFMRRGMEAVTDEGSLVRGPRPLRREDRPCVAQASSLCLHRQDADGISFDGPYGQLMYALVAGLAELEREAIRERVKAGPRAAKARSEDEWCFCRRVGTPMSVYPKPSDLSPPDRRLVGNSRVRPNTVTRFQDRKRTPGTYVRTSVSKSE